MGDHNHQTSIALWGGGGNIGVFPSQSIESKEIFKNNCIEMTFHPPQLCHPIKLTKLHLLTNYIQSLNEVKHSSCIQVHLTHLIKNHLAMFHSSIFTRKKKTISTWLILI